MKTIIQQEIQKRWHNDDDAYKLIGAEIKRRRVNQAQTLSSVAGDVCSVSYLCKVEKNQLKPNRHMLKEICNKLNLESPKMNLLFQMREMILNAAIAYSEEKFQEISKEHNKCFEFDNYKSQLIDFIYYISLRKIKEAKDVATELLKLLNVMKDLELNIFIIFYSILLYFEENYLEAIDNLYHVLKLERNDDIILLIYKVLFDCYYKLNNPFAVKYCETIINILLQRMDINGVNKYRYYLSLFYVKNKMREDVEFNMNLITNETYKTSIQFILDCIDKEKSTVSYEKLRPFMRLLYSYLYNKKDYRKNYHEINYYDLLDLDFNDNIAAYLTLNSIEDKYKEIYEVYIPNTTKSRNMFDRIFFINEFCKLCLELGRYKPFAKAYKDFFKDGEWY